MKRIVMAFLAALVLLGVGCGPDEDPGFTPTTPQQYSDTYSGAGDQVFHVAAGGGESFDYTLDLGTAVKDVYFVFTNTSASERQIPTVSASVIPKGAGGGSPVRSPFLPETRVAQRGTPEISRFNNDPPLEGLPIAKGPTTFPPPSAPSYDAVGGKNSFMFESTSVGLIPATCRKVVSGVSTDFGDKTLNIWVADDCWTDGGTKSRLIDQDMVDALAAKFLAAGEDNDIYDWVTNIYGEEWGTTPYSNLIDPDDEITILLYDIDDDNSTAGGIVGFFYGKDNFVAGPDPGIEYSNQRVMFYIDAVMYAQEEPDGGSWEITDFWPSEIVSTLAHEFQHMIHFYQKNVTRVSGGGGTETWLNEMLSMATEDIVADKLGVDGPRGVDYDDPTAGVYPLYQGRLPLYNYYNDISLTYWPPITDPAVFYSYSINYAFGAYLMRNYGGATFLRNVLLNAYTGSDAIDAALTAGGYGVDFATVLQRWGAANLLSDSTVAPPGYRYNVADWFPSLEGVAYRLGSINLYNYVLDPGGIDHEGPYIYTGAPIGAFGSHPPAANIYYRLGSDLTGLVDANVYMGSGVRLTVVVKDD